MRLTRPSLTIRHLMTATLVVAVGLGLASWINRRSADFRLVAARHRQGYADQAPVPSPYHVGPLVPRPVTQARQAYHWAMYTKYDQAARQSWLPVAPDPPEPE
jgi:hypothetical protein